MDRHLDMEMADLKKKIILMASNVESSLQAAIEGFLQRDQRRIQDVFEFERQINTMQLAVDEDCVRLLARFQPMATDLRLIVACIKINTDLERLGDQAVNIAKNATFAIRNSGNPPIVPDELQDMVAGVTRMLHDAIDAFVNRNTTLAQKVLESDDEIDNAKNAILHMVMQRLKSHPEETEQGFNTVLIARNLEKVGDHTTNIAEDVIYLVSGQDVRHAPPEKTEP